MSSPLPSSLRGLLAAVAVTAVLLAQSAGGATLPNLYVVTVSPDPAARDQRAAAIQAAMARLLIRVTGNRNAPLDPVMRPMLSNADRYLASYGLDRQRQPQVGFLRSPVEQALTALGMPVWGPERPLTLLWVAMDDGLGGRALLGANDANHIEGVSNPAMTASLKALRTELLAVADERGLPIELPLLDLEDLGAVTFADVWGGFEDRVSAASQRYRADAVLIGRVRPGIVGNEIQWLFLRGLERRVVIGDALRDGLDAAADAYAAETSTVGGVSATLISVRGVASSADYGRVMSYLEQQSVLQSVDVESLENGVLNLRVAARGDARVLERIFSLGGVLRPAAATGGQPTFEIVRTGSGP